MGGAVVQAFGCAALAFGLFAGTLLGVLVAVVGALTGVFSATAGWIVGGIVALISLLVFWGLRKGGKKLEEHGEETLEQRREQTVFALAANHGGVLQVEQVARALEVPTEQADELLTRLAKDKQSEVGLEVGEQGELFYTFARYLDPSRLPKGSAWGPSTRERLRFAELERSAVAGPEAASPTSSDAVPLDEPADLADADPVGARKAAR